MSRNKVQHDAKRKW